MYYSLYDATYAALLPTRLALAWTASLDPSLWRSTPLEPFARYANAGATVWSGLLERRAKPAWKIEPVELGGRNVPVIESVVQSHPFCDLRRFVVEGANPRTKILVVAPLSGHYATLLRGTVQELAREHDVYVTDWANASHVPLSAGIFDLDAYVDELIAFMRHLAPDLHVLAVCQPAPLVIAAISLLAQWNDPAQPASMTLMGGPIDTRVAPTAPTKLAASKPLEWFERNLIDTVPAWYPGGGRRVYPGFVQLSAFVMMNAERHRRAQMEMFDDLVRGDTRSAGAKQAFYDEYFAVLDLDAAYYLQTVRAVFQEHDLPLGRMTWRGEAIEPSAIRKTALMTVEGEKDDISAPGQTFAAHAICSAVRDDRRDHHLQAGAGHYGIFSGTRWREAIAPRIGNFVRANAAA